MADEIFDALSARRRRLALRHLQRHRTMSLADLAELVAEHERGTDARKIADERVKDVYMSLYHHHVPVLEDADLARYEQERDLVRIAEEVSTVLDVACDRIQAIRSGRVR